MFVIKRIPTILFVITRNNFFPNASILGNINLHKSPIFFNPVCYIPIKQDTNDQRRVKRIIKRTFHAVKILWKHCRWCSILCNEGIRLNFWYALREIELVGFVLTAWSEKEDVTSGSTSGECILKTVAPVERRISFGVSWPCSRNIDETLQHVQ